MTMFTTQLRSYHVDALAKLKLTLGHLWVIESWIAGNKVEVKETQRLRELDWIKDNELTVLATGYYEGICNMTAPAEGKKVKKVVVQLDIETEAAWSRFWKAWPSNNGFSWNGKKFEATRNMRGGTEAECKKLWLKAIQADKKKPEQILHAVKAMLTNAMDRSYHTGKNELQYLNGLVPFLRQQVYNAWEQVKIKEEYKKEEEQIQKQSNSTDVW